MTAIHPTEDRTQLFHSSRTILQQGVDLLRSVADQPDLLTRPSQYMPQSTIGKHFRHVYDHYHLFLKALPSYPLSTSDALADLPVVAYDRRDRKVPMENDPMAAVCFLEQLIDQLGTLAARLDLLLDMPVEVRAQVDPKSPDTVPLRSTLSRELWFCTHHAIHHYAMVKVMCMENGLDVPADFGIAPSTLKHAGEGEAAATRC